MEIYFSSYKLTEEYLRDILASDRAEDGLIEPTRITLCEGCPKGFAKYICDLLGLGDHVKYISKNPVKI